TARGDVPSSGRKATAAQAALRRRTTRPARLPCPGLRREELDFDAFDVLARARVDANGFSLIDERGNLDLGPRLHRRCFRDVARRVAAYGRLGVGDLHVNVRRRLDLDDAVVPVQQQA